MGRSLWGPQIERECTRRQVYVYGARDECVGRDSIAGRPVLAPPLYLPRNAYAMQLRFHVRGSLWAEIARHVKDQYNFTAPYSTKQYLFGDGYIIRLRLCKLGVWNPADGIWFILWLTLYGVSRLQWINESRQIPVFNTASTYTYSYIYDCSKLTIFYITYIIIWTTPRPAIKTKTKIV